MLKHSRNGNEPPDTQLLEFIVTGLDKGRNKLVVIVIKFVNKIGVHYTVPVQWWKFFNVFKY